MSSSLTWHAVHNNQGSISDTESSSHFRREVDVTRRVNQVDQEAGAILGLLNEGHVIFAQLVEQGDGAAKGDRLLDMKSDVKCNNLSVPNFVPGRNPSILIILLLLFKMSQHLFRTKSFFPSCQSVPTSTAPTGPHTHTPHNTHTHTHD